MGPLYALRGKTWTNMENKKKAIIAEDVKRVKFTIEEGEQMADELEERMQIVREKLQAIKTELKEVLLLVPETEWLKKMTVQNCTGKLLKRTEKLRDIKFPEFDWQLVEDINTVNHAFSNFRDLVFESYMDDDNEEERHRESRKFFNYYS